MTVSGTIVIGASPAEVYAVVSDPSRTRGYSPENTGATLTGDAARPGDSFTGTNRRGPARWVTRCTVTHAEPAQRFAFRVHEIGVRTPRLRAPIATWDYRLRPVDAGTEVTETWTDDRAHWPDWVARAFDFVATGGVTFARFQRRNIETTLRNLKNLLEH